jgi:hypothetical protein
MRSPVSRDPSLLTVQTFELVNWIACLATSALLLVGIRRNRYLLVKPSVLLVVFFHMMIQWAATIEAATIYETLPNPVAFAILAHGFPLVVFLGGLWLLQHDARAVFRSLTMEGGYSQARFVRIGLITGTVVLVVLSLYLNYVGFANTGLFALLSGFSDADVAREESLKLLPSLSIQYGYAFMAATAAPFAITAFAVWGVRARGLMRGKSALAAAALVVAILAAVSMSGARGYGAHLILVLLFCWFFRRGAPFQPGVAIVAALLVLTVPAISSVIREGQELTAGTLYVYYLGIIDRTFKTPMWIGYYYVHFAQTDHFFGIGAIPKLAAFWDVPFQAPANIIGLTYVANRIQTIHANGSFVFTYYSYFGLWVFPLCCLGAWLLDVALVVYRRLSREMLLLTVPAIAACVQNLTSADYTTALLTHGFVPILAFATVLDHLVPRQAARRSLSMRSSCLQGPTPSLAGAPATYGRRRLVGSRQAIQ